MWWQVQKKKKRCIVCLSYDRKPETVMSSDHTPQALPTSLDIAWEAVMDGFLKTPCAPYLVLCSIRQRKEK